MTVTANLYCNLAAWSSGTKTAGNCVSASGNAYRCITGGTSATTPSGTSTSPTSFGSDTSTWVWLSAITFSGTDVALMFSAAVAGATSIGGLTGTITQPIVWQLWNVNSATQTTTTHTSSLLTLTGHSFTPTNNLTITCAPGESFRDQGSGNALAFNPANGVSITLPNFSGGGQNYINITDPNVSFNGIQIKDPNATSGSTVIQLNSGANNFALRNCIVDGTAQSGGAAIIFLSSTTGNVFTNSFLIDRQATNSNAAAYLDSGTSTSTGVIINCTLVAINPQSTQQPFTIASTTSAGWHIRNTVSIGYADGISTSNPGVVVFDHCGTDASVIGGVNATDNGNELVSQTVANMFVSSTTDFRLKSGSPFINAGTTDATDIPTADDIFRTSRPQGTAWCMGAFEFPLTAASLAETAATSTSFTETTDTAATLSETAATSDSYTIATASFRTLSETAATSDSWTQTPAMAGTLSETAATSDVWIQTTTSTRTLSETAATSDLYTGNIVNAPWLTSNCAYSAASFSAGNFGTDAGGSVFGITSSVFVGFPTNMNPASGSVVIDAGATDTTDIPSAVDAFGNSRPQGSSWDIGAVELLGVARTITRDFPTLFEFQRTVPNENLTSTIEWKQGYTADIKIPSEWQSISASLAITQMPIEFLRNIPATDVLAPIEWKVSTGILSTRDVVIPVEWGVGRQRDLSLSTEFRQSLAINALTPIEWTSTPLSVTTDIKMPLEILHGKSSDYAVPTEWGASVKLPVIRDMPIAVEWLGQTSFSVDTKFALEMLQGSSTTATIPGEWMGGVTANFVVPLEAKGAYQTTMTVPVESNVSLLRDGVVPTEWGALTSFNADAAFAVEWQRALARDIVVPVTWLGAQFGPLNVPIALEWTAARAVDITGPAEWRASLQANNAGPIEWTQTFASVTKTLPLEFGQGVIADIQFPVVTLTNLQRDAIAPLEWNTALALQFNINIPVEFSAGVQGVKTIAIEWSSPLIVDNAIPLASGSSLAADGRLRLEVLGGVQADAIIPVEPGGGVAGTAAIPLEFGHLTFTTTADFNMPLEINSLVVGGIVVPIDLKGTRLTIGSRLEPDAWERQHD